MKLTNCINCGEVFARNVIDICRKCYLEEEEAFKKVSTFLRKQKNRSATLSEIAEATEVKEDLIIKFLKQNRLRAADFPQLKYPCELCGDLISEQRYCNTCTKEFQTGWQEAKAQVAQSTNEQEQRSAYYFIDPKRNS